MILLNWPQTFANDCTPYLRRKLHWEPRDGIVFCHFLLSEIWKILSSPSHSNPRMEQSFPRVLGGDCLLFLRKSFPCRRMRTCLVIWATWSGALPDNTHLNSRPSPVSSLPRPSWPMRTSLYSKHLQILHWNSGLRFSCHLYLWLQDQEIQIKWSRAVRGRQFEGIWPHGRISDLLTKWASGVKEQECGRADRPGHPVHLTAAHDAGRAQTLEPHNWVWIFVPPLVSWVNSGTPPHASVSSSVKSK